MKNILINVDTLERFQFFRRMINSLLRLNYRIIFVTNKLSVYLLATKYKYKVFILNRTKCDYKITVEQELNLKTKSLEVSTEVFTLDTAMTLYTAVYSQLIEINENYLFDMAFIWNGTKTIDMAVTQFCNQNSILKVYMEISNIPGKLFLDSRGVNAQSALFGDITILEKYSSSRVIEFEKWKEDYLKSKVKNHLVPQAKSVTNLNWWFIVDYLGFKLFGLQDDGKANFLEKISKRFQKKNNLNFYDISLKESLTQKYVFFPLQVSDDSQILINSNIDNIEALKIAKKIAAQNKAELYVKPHPAERNANYIAEIDQLREKIGFQLVNENTFLMIRNAYMIVTINSTVGLEAKILGKPVKFLGKTFYSALNNENLKNYILEYLIDMDYFAEDDISLIQIETLIKRVLSEC